MGTTSVKGSDPGSRRITDHQARYFAHLLIRRCFADSGDRLAAALVDAQVDLNPHQVEAALFAFRSPLSKGAILADEVGLGKTIEAGLVISQIWAERKRRILVIVPSNLRKQWYLELSEKFFLPCAILEAGAYHTAIKQGRFRPFEDTRIVICSYQFARSKAGDVQAVPWDLVVFDEAHRHSFIASNVWQKRYSRENREAIGDVHEYILVYAMNINSFKAHRNRIPLSEDQAKVYKNPNNDPKGRWRGIPMTAQGFRSNQMYEIKSPSGDTHRPPEGRCWSMIESEFLALRDAGRVYFGKDGDSQPSIIRYLSEVEGLVPWTWWGHEEVGHTDEAKKEIHALFGKVDAFNTPKPERLMKRIIEIARNPGDLILDSFAGSGTTGAVAHKMGRRWIMVELGEHCHTHIIPRLKKVIDGADPGGVTEAAGWKGGGGFRYYRLAPSLLEKDKYGQWVIHKEYNAAMLAEALCKLEGFTYAPSDTVYWQQGRSTERDFIYVTTATLGPEQIQELSDEVGSDRTLLVLCGAFRGKAEFQNLTVRKIPKRVLARCEWGHDDYSLQVENLPKAPTKEGQQPLFGDGEGD